MNKRQIIIIVISTLIIIALLLGFKTYNKIEEYKKEKNTTKNEIDFIEKTIIEEPKEKEFENGILGILQIDKINMKGVVKEGSSSEVLKNYVGHIENTPKYTGNIGLAAHNRGNLYSYFAKINQLTTGDEIKYITLFGENYYRVDNIKEIDEHDWTLLEDTDEDKLTLITCVKDKRSKRLCVQATRDKTNTRFIG